MSILPRRLPRGQLYLDPPGLLAHAPRRWRIRGTLVQQLEDAVRLELEAPHAVALPHARVALQLLLRALAIPRGSEVVLTPVTIPDIVRVLRMEGLVPVFADLGPRTANIDVQDLERKITARTRLLLITHLCGIPSDMPRIMDLARRHRLEVLEDTSQTQGTRSGGTALGLFGRAGFFSLTSRKPVCSVFGGMTVTSDEALARELRRLQHVLDPPLPAALLGRLLARDVLFHAATTPAVFSRLTWHALTAETLFPRLARDIQRGTILQAEDGPPSDRLPQWRYARYGELQASLALEGLATLEEGNRRRRALAVQLWEHLAAAGVQGIPALAHPEECTFWRFPLWTPEPARLRRHLRARGIDTAPTNLACAADLPEARRFVDGMLFLPMHPTLTPRDMRRIAEAVAEYPGCQG